MRNLLNWFRKVFMKLYSFINRMWNAVVRSPLLLVTVSLCLVVIVANFINLGLDWSADKLHKQGSHSQSEGKHEDAVSYMEWSLLLREDYYVVQQLGSVKMELGKYREAIEHFSDAIELYPESGETFYLRGQAKEALGLYHWAIDDFDEAVNLGGFSSTRPPRIIYYRGKLKARMGLYESARLDYDEALSLHPYLPDRFQSDGGSAYHSEEYEKSIAYLDDALALRPDYTAALLYRGLAKTALGRHQDAVLDFGAYASLEPYSTEALYLYGAASAYLGRHEDAIAAFSEYIDMNLDNPIEGYYIHIEPGSDLQEKQNLQNIFYMRGDSLYELGRYSEAISDFIEVMAISDRPARISGVIPYKYELALAVIMEQKPGYMQALYYRGVAKLSMSEYERAISHFDSIIEIEPHEPYAYNYRGRAYMSLSRYEEAVEDFNNAISIKPDYADAFYRRGSYQINMKKYEEALVDLNEAVRLQPDHVRALFSRYIANHRLGRLEQAISDLDRAILVEPDVGGMFFLRGMARYEFGDYEGAIADLESPHNNMISYYNIGEANMKLGRYEEAITAFAREIASNEGYFEYKNVYPFYYMAKAKVALELHEEAATDYRESIKLINEQLNEGMPQMESKREVEYRQEIHELKDMAEQEILAIAEITGENN